MHTTRYREYTVQDTHTVSYIIRKRATRKAGGDLQENKKFWNRYYTEVCVERIQGSGTRNTAWTIFPFFLLLIPGKCPVLQ